MIQGSILGQILYAIYVSPLFDLVELYNFADDNFSLTTNSNLAMAQWPKNNEKKNYRLPLNG